MRAWLVVFLVACGGGGDSSTLDATVTIAASPTPFSEECIFTKTGETLDIFASNGRGIAIEAKWQKAAIAQPGTYMTNGIVPDLMLLALFHEPGELDDKILMATGSVTFTEISDDGVLGTFDMAVPNSTFMATGSFDCH